MPESIFNTTHCHRCGRDTSRNGVTKYYDLRHTHIPQGDERIEVGGGRTMPVPNFDSRRPTHSMESSVRPDVSPTTWSPPAPRLHTGHGELGRTSSMTSPRVS